MDERWQEGLGAAMEQVLILLLHPRKDLILQLWWLSRGQIFKERSNSVYLKNCLWELILREGCRTEPLVMAARCYSSHITLLPLENPTANRNPQTKCYISHLKTCKLKLLFSIFFGAIYYQRYLMPSLTWFSHVIMFMPFFQWGRSCSLA